MAQINIGDVRRVSVVFATTAGVATDPTAVLLYYKKPGTAYITLTYGVDAALIKDSVGNYHADLTLDTAGTWQYEWRGTGALVADEGGQFRVYGGVVRG